MSTEIDELKQARYRSDKTISGHNAFLRPPTGETDSVDTRGFYFVLKEPHPILSVLWLSVVRSRTFFEASPIPSATFRFADRAPPFLAQSRRCRECRPV